MNCFFRNWKITTAILSIVILMALFIGSVGFLGYYYSAKANVQMNDIYLNNLMSVKDLNDARAQSRAGEVALLDFLLATNKDKQKALQNEIKTRADNYDKGYSAYIKLLADSYELERQRKIKTELTTFRAERQRVMDMANQGDQKGAYDYYINNTQSHLDIVNTALQELADFNAKEADNTNSQNDVDYAVSVKFLIAIPIAAALLFLALGFAVASLISKRSRKRSEEQNTLLVKKNQELNLLILNTINALSSAVEAKDSYLRGHSLNVAELSMRISEQLNLPSETVNNIYLAGLLHDIGKIGVDEAILNKTSKLTAEEFSRIKEHPILGSNIVSKIPEFVELVPLIRAHHERWDGSGYPHGLCADTIPLGARILSVADSYDAMTSDRVYHKALKPSEAILELEYSSGKQFDPMVVNAVISVLTKEIKPRLILTTGQSTSVS